MRFMPEGFSYMGGTPHISTGKADPVKAIVKAAESAIKTGLPLALPVSPASGGFANSFTNEWKNLVPSKATPLATAAKNWMPYLPGIGMIAGGAPEAGFGSMAGTYAGSAAAGAGLLGHGLLNAWLPGIGGILGAGLGSLFQNDDPDKYLWADEVKRITGNNPDGWGSGGDWSQWLQQNKGLDKGTADYYGAAIRQKQMSPSQALAAISGNTGNGNTNYAEGGYYHPASGASSAASMFGAGGVAEIPPFQMPGFVSPQRFDPIQSELAGIASDILKGTPPEYYAPIGEAGGELFENMIAGITNDVTKAAQSNEVARNMGRGGTGIVGETVAKTTAPIRYQDYLRALQGRQSLLGYGTDVLTNVRGADVDMSKFLNEYNLKGLGMKTDYDLNKANMISNYAFNTDKMNMNYGLSQQELALKKDQIEKNYQLGLMSYEQRQRQLDAIEEQNKSSMWGDILDTGVTWLKNSYDIGSLFGGGTTGGTNFSGDVLKAVAPEQGYMSDFSNTSYDLNRLLNPDFNRTYGKAVLAV